MSTEQKSRIKIMIELDESGHPVQKLPRGKNNVPLELLELFPDLYKNVKYGYSVGEGWYWIIKELSYKLNNYTISCVQLKEKFGTLRVYVSYPEYTSKEERIELDTCIYRAERYSGITCEWCGDYGNTRTGSWIKTLCDSCNKLYESRK